MTLVISAIMPKTYTATASLVVNTKGIDTVSGVTVPAQVLPGYLATQVDIINSMSVALQAVDALKLTEDPEFRQRFLDATDGKGDIRYWIAEQIKKKLKVVPSRESSVLEISFKARNPQLASDGANAFARAYQNTTARLRTEPLNNVSKYFNEQIKTLRDNLEHAQKRLTVYQQEKGIFNIDSNLDVETMRMNELSSQLVAAQGQLIEAQSRRRQALGKDADESPEVMANPLIQNLKALLAQAEARLAQVNQKVMPGHPEHQRAQAEVDRLRAELRSNLRGLSNSVGNQARILEAREASLRAALEEQKAKVLGLNQARDELMLLTREVDIARKAYEHATQRFQQTSLEGQSNQPDVVLLNRAPVPPEPSSPILTLNLLVSIFIGSLLGIGIAIFNELRDRRVRSIADLEEILHVPVLGSLQMHPPPKRRLGAALLPRLTFRAP